MQYRLMCGNHREGNKKYEQGALVTSDRPLDRIFIGKFHRVLEPAALDQTRARRRTVPPGTRPTAVVRPTGDGYDVLNPATGKRINTQALTEQEAQAMVEGR